MQRMPFIMSRVMEKDTLGPRERVTERRHIPDDLDAATERIPQDGQIGLNLHPLPCVIVGIALHEENPVNYDRVG